LLTDRKEAQTLNTGYLKNQKPRLLHYEPGLETHHTKASTEHFLQFINKSFRHRMVNILARHLGELFEQLALART
jgi:hypothetical protein